MDFNPTLGTANDLEKIDLDEKEQMPLPKTKIMDESALITKSRTPFENLECESKEWNGGFELYTCFDPLTNELVFKAEVPDNSWLGIGFGTTMTNTDMIAWFVTDGVGEVKDLYSTGYSSPEDDTS